MIALALTLLLAQIAPAPAGTLNGVATGVVLSSTGTPAAGVRVYAMPAHDLNDSTNNPLVFESLAQTDATGHYRLEVPGGRYYIAAGSVESPTYFPNTNILSSAREILITAGTTVEGINFSKFVAAPPAGLGFPGFVFTPIPVPQPPNSTGVLSGIVQFDDGSPARNFCVIALPTSTLVTGSATFLISPNEALNQANNLTAVNVNAMPATMLSMMRLVRGATRTMTDDSGRFRLDNLPADSYYVVGGYADAPIFYPGTLDIGSATVIKTTPATMLDTVNFTIGPSSNGLSIRGRASDMTGEPATRATLVMSSLDPAPTGIASMLTQRSFKRTAVGSDGSFEMTNVIAGTYSLVASFPGSPPLTKTIVVSDRVVNLDLEFPIAVLSAKVLWDDGSPVSFPVVTEVAVRRISIPELFSTIVFPAALGGAFNMALESGQYRFFIRDFPQGYTIRSAQSGTTDLIQNPLVIDRKKTADIEVRIAKNGAASNGDSNGGRVRGKLLDASTGLPTSASRLQLCCFTNGPIERLSTAIDQDGSFEFTNVPTGEYTAEVETIPPTRIVQPTIVVGSKEPAEHLLVSSRLFASISVSVDTDGPGLPQGTAVTVTLASQLGFRIMKSGVNGESIFFFVPADVRYTVEVSDIPESLRVKSITSGTTDLRTTTLNLSGAPTPVIQIKLTAREPK